MSIDLSSKEVVQSDWKGDMLGSRSGSLDAVSKDAEADNGLFDESLEEADGVDEDDDVDYSK